MYNPKRFAQTDTALLLEVMQKHNFATVVSNLDGAPFASHLPLVVRQDGDSIHIEGHFARGNPHWGALESDPKVLVIFNGPHTYISPSHLKSIKNVPTWNYIAVHATGNAVIDHSSEGKLAMLGRLIGQHEAEYQAQWDGLEADYHEKMLRAIVGFSVRVDALQGKFKLDQSDLADHKPSMQTSHEEGSPDQREMAQWMKRLGYWS